MLWILAFKFWLWYGGHYIYQPTLQPVWYYSGIVCQSTARNVKNCSFRSHQTCKSNDQFLSISIPFYEVHVHLLYPLKKFRWIVLIYTNLWHISLMFWQIIYIPDLLQKLWEKMCGLYFIVYSNCCSELSRLTNQDDSKF